MVQLHPSMDPVLLPNSQLDHRPVSCTENQYIEPATHLTKTDF